MAVNGQNNQGLPKIGPSQRHMHENNAKLSHITNADRMLQAQGPSSANVKQLHGAFGPAQRDFANRNGNQYSHQVPMQFHGGMGGDGSKSHDNAKRRPSSYNDFQRGGHTTHQPPSSTQQTMVNSPLGNGMNFMGHHGVPGPHANQNMAIGQNLAGSGSLHMGPNNKQTIIFMQQMNNGHIDAVERTKI